MQVMGGETAPAPRVLQFVKSVLGVGPVAVKLAEAKETQNNST